MKEILMIVSMSLVPMTAKAWVVPGNPDVCPSVGLHATTSKISGNRSEVDNPGATLERAFVSPEKRERDTFGADIRVPVHEAVTMDFSYDSINVSDTFTRSGNIYKQTSNLDGYELGVGVRVYLK